MYKIAFLLLPEFQLLGFTNAIEALRAANSLFPNPKFNVRIVHDNDPNIISSGGWTVQAIDGHVSEQDDVDTLVVCCSFGYDKYTREETQRLLRRYERHGTRLGSIESGAYLLAQAGLLNGHTATAHFNNFPLFAQLFPEVVFVREIFTISPTRMSAAGGTACLDLMLALIREQLGADVEMRVANLLVHPDRRDGATFLDNIFTSNHSDLPALVRDASRIMECEMDPPLQIEIIAANLMVSRRHLDRKFIQAVGTSAAEHYRQLRLARARKLIKATQIDLATIANKCGFWSYSHFLRRYRETFGRSPSRDRITPDGLNSDGLSPARDLHPYQKQLDSVKLI